jgi:hypothetical protein
MKNLFSAQKEEDLVPVLAETPHYSRHMVGTYINPTNGEWMLIQVSFDPATLQLGEVVTERATGNLEVARERLFIKMGNLGLTEAGDFTEEKKTKLY